MTRFCRCQAGLLLLLLVTVAGCGSSGPSYKLAHVSGKVTMDGKPLAGANVLFVPMDVKSEPGKLQPSSTGLTDEQGNYSLKFDIDGREGAVVGQHRVQVVKMERGGEGKPARGQVIPHEYNGPTSTLQFTVPEGGTKEANFALSSTGAAPPRRGR